MDEKEENSLFKKYIYVELRLGGFNNQKLHFKFFLYLSFIFLL
ncbi:hypothetical protein BAC_B0126 (plasmid) [Bacillus anthracis str. A0488]|nr:hypothetical protein BAMEG_B0047 [Bacillus anthracis str. CDC 684]ACQ45918.1 hypothetical protein BAA_B0048 [Bacillus anthracis str. A0248]AFH87114.1 Hypothetical Protein H9401_5729 [Bacillus anthracis str. H9401]AHK41872.1 hypothetical protein BAPAT_pXO20050 [Bacillus anthracis str. SVA11]EDR16252.1 hypothetical protein BAC_B0126 [Bacillus anthracis str. A0488]EDR85116.1 hypothetical protein BAQ_B0003 [Bacillus anthracis str. A0193]EDR90425.1 hypothetical protein BAH_B0080 [Bacillus anthr